MSQRRGHQDSGPRCANSAHVARLLRWAHKRAGRMERRRYRQSLAAALALLSACTTLAPTAEPAPVCDSSRPLDDRYREAWLHWLNGERLSDCDAVALTDGYRVISQASTPGQGDR